MMIYRKKKLLSLAKECPRCMCCGIENPNRDLLCAAHSNQLRDGKGRGLKAHDFRIAYVCDKCHKHTDSNKDAWERSHFRSICWLFERSYLFIEDPSILKKPLWSEANRAKFADMFLNGQIEVKL